MAVFTFFFGLKPTLSFFSVSSKHYFLLNSSAVCLISMSPLIKFLRVSFFYFKFLHNLSWCEITVSMTSLASMLLLLIFYSNSYFQVFRISLSSFYFFVSFILPLVCRLLWGLLNLFSSCYFYSYYLYYLISFILKKSYSSGTYCQSEIMTVLSALLSTFSLQIYLRYSHYYFCCSDIT